MSVIQYQKIYQWFMARPVAYRLLKLLYRGSAIVVALFYLGLIAYRGCVFLTVGVSGGVASVALQDLLLVVLVPAGGYLAGTVLRARLNYKRPYEQEGFVPLIAKDKKGHSFPSRHAVSASVIAVTWWWTSPIVSMLLGAFVLLISVVRVLAGVHSIRDVMAGVCFGGLFAAFILLSMYSV